MHILDLFEKLWATNKKSEKIALLSAKQRFTFSKVIYLAHLSQSEVHTFIPTYECLEILAFSNMILHSKA